MFSTNPRPQSSSAADIAVVVWITFSPDVLLMLSYLMGVLRRPRRRSFRGLDLTSTLREAGEGANDVLVVEKGEHIGRKTDQMPQPRLKQASPSDARSSNQEQFEQAIVSCEVWCQRTVWLNFERRGWCVISEM